MKTGFINFLKGMFVGIANIIPGVSGGTIAVILGLFDKIIEAINNFTKDMKKYILFLLPIGLGAVFSILCFSSLLKFCLDNYSMPTSVFFVGLVCGSIPLIYNKSTKNGFKLSYIFAFVISLAVVVILSMFDSDSAAGQIPAITPLFLLKIFLGGVIAAAAMVVPGISGSFIMVLLGIYPIIITALSNIPTILMNLSDIQLMINTGTVLCALGLGVVVGILLISKIISFLLTNFYSITYYSILGLIVGSIYGIFNSPMTYQSGVNLFSVISSTLTFAIGFFVSLKLGDEK